jgi:hypothetical protein
MLNSPRIEQVISQRKESVSESASSFIDIESSISTSELNPWNLGGSGEVLVEREGL